MERGTRLDVAGQPEEALAAFEKARTLSPLDVNAASACAALLSRLDCPQSAYRTLLTVEAALLQDADGAANLAIAAEGCGDFQKAQSAYARALDIDPAHLRSLNNVAILAARSSQWDVAIHLARRCIALQPGHAPHHANLAEYLGGARRYPEALESIGLARAQFPQHCELRLRQVALMAFQGELENADAALQGFDAHTRELLGEFLLKLETAEGGALEGSIRSTASDRAADDALWIHVQQAFRDLAVCSWRRHHGLGEILKQALNTPRAAGQLRNWGHAAFQGLLLGMDEDVLRKMRRQQVEETGRGVVPRAPFKAPSPAARARRDNRLHVGLAVQSLADPRQVRMLEQQLALHDHSRFSMHVYSFTGRPDPNRHESLFHHAVSVNELGHMTDLEAVGRLRLDRLDLYVELALNPAWTRQDIAVMRVAPVQLRHPGLYSCHVQGAWDYLVSDHSAHPEVDQDAGPIVRLPQTCLLPSPGLGDRRTVASRETCGLPADALVLVSCLWPGGLDVETFASWMRILRSLPDAVLWLPLCGRAAANIVLEAQAAGVGATRLIFSGPMNWQDLGCAVGSADLLLDSFRVNDPSGVEDALRLGLPALTCEGRTMASRLGGSMLRAAGLPECVLDSPQAYVAEAVRLGRAPEALKRLRASVNAAAGTAPLFDLPARVKDWETAWTMMAERSRAGLPPAAFDVPPAASRHALSIQ
ncbi:MAG: hypothetical protein JWQ72_3708 [Polaromonas sp.]|nr:hypothetical protein [Polaromonas sp.]